MPRRPGVAYFPAEFRIVANVHLFWIEYATSTYVSAPGVFLTTPATPALPRAPTPVGKFTAVLNPTLSFHGRLTDERYSVKLYVVPDPSERYTGVTFMSGRLRPGLSVAIRWS